MKVLIKITEKEFWAICEAQSYFMTKAEECKHKRYQKYLSKTVKNLSSVVKKFQEGAMSKS